MVRQKWARGFSGCRQWSGRIGPEGLVIIGNGQAKNGLGVYGIQLIFNFHTRSFISFKYGTREMQSQTSGLRVRISLGQLLLDVEE